MCKVPENYLDQENQPSTSSNKFEPDIESILAVGFYISSVLHRISDANFTTNLKNIPTGSTFDELIDYCKDCLSKIIDQEFRRVYEHLSDQIYVIKPPWQSLKTVLEVILK